ncbi:hypothetical protein [Mycolicibacterium sp. lyk4-40-TYG-92]|uniref:hypothetical protein n=1 Tax=Mycolicibacterium sp. lyk4-40-TYG-92 TaxID=3040295 RepID=UPI00254B01F9|nr:hypothetical protein [Mycolicibacterium sp. lyk4-40-TYG-92]
MNRALWINQNPSQLDKDFQALFTSHDDPLLRHVRTRIKSRQTNGVIERFFGTLNDTVDAATSATATPPTWKPTTSASSTTPSDPIEHSATAPPNLPTS